MVESRHGGTRRFIAIIALIVACGATPGAAQTRSPGIAAVLACRSMLDATQQLTCFQKASETLAAEQNGRSSPSEGSGQETAAPVKRPFGAPKTQVARAAKPKAKDQDSLKVRVLSLTDRGDGRVAFRFDDGSTWVQTQSDESVEGSLKVGDEVTLRHGLFSSYMLEIRGRSSIHVKRVGGG